MNRARKSPTEAPSIQRGAALASAIEKRGNDQGLKQKEVAKLLGFSEAYFNFLLSGERWFGSVAEDKLQRISEFLDVPLLTVYMLAEIIHPEDFFRPSTIEQQVDGVFEALCSDRRFATIVPTPQEWRKTPLRVRLLCAIFYQDLSRKDLLEKFQLIKVKAPPKR